MSVSGLNAAQANQKWSWRTIRSNFAPARPGDSVAEDVPGAPRLVVHEHALVDAAFESERQSLAIGLGYEYPCSADFGGRLDEHPAQRRQRAGLEEQDDVLPAEFVVHHAFLGNDRMRETPSTPLTLTAAIRAWATASRRGRSGQPPRRPAPPQRPAPGGSRGRCP